MLGGPNSIQTPDHPNSLTVFRYIVVRAFQKDAVATGLPDWSKMNSDLYNLHVWYPPVPSTRQLLQHSSITSPATVSPGPVWTSLDKPVLPLLEGGSVSLAVWSLQILTYL